jgi:hypothetical protein
MFIEVLVIITLYILIGVFVFKLPPKKPYTSMYPFLAYTAFTPVSLLLSWLILLARKDIYICLSIDADLSNTVQDKKAIQKILQLLNKLKLKNKVTWFINNEYKWTTTYKKELTYLIKNYDVQLHSHHLSYNKTGAEKAYAKEKKTLERFVKTYDKTYQCIAFRAGEHITSKSHFKILNKLGFKIDSSVMPGKYLADKYDFRKTPLNKSHYYESKILELPTYNKLPGISLMNTVLPSKSPIFISFFFHPFEIVQNNKINRIKLLQIRTLLLLNKLHFPTARWISVKDAYNKVTN